LKFVSSPQRQPETHDSVLVIGSTRTCGWLQEATRPRERHPLYRRLGREIVTCPVSRQCEALWHFILYPLFRGMTPPFAHRVTIRLSPNSKRCQMFVFRLKTFLFKLKMLMTLEWHLIHYCRGFAYIFFVVIAVVWSFCPKTSTATCQFNLTTAQWRS
jgi:hypothetical protein